MHGPLRARRWRRAAAGGLAVVVLAGCGTTVTGTGRPGPAVSAAAAATPFGEVGADGAQAFDAMAADMLALEHGFEVDVGADGTGLTLRSRFQGDDGSAEVGYGDAIAQFVGVAGKAWVKAPAEFYEQLPKVSADIRAQVADRWVTVAGPIATYSVYVDAQGFFDGLRDRGAIALGEESTIDGDRVQELRDGEGVSLFVTLASPHRLVRYGDGDSTTITFPTDGLEVDVPTDPIDFPG